MGCSYLGNDGISFDQLEADFHDAEVCVGELEGEPRKDAYLKLGQMRGEINLLLRKDYDDETTTRLEGYLDRANKIDSQYHRKILLLNGRPLGHSPRTTPSHSGVVINAKSFRGNMIIGIEKR